MKITQQQIADVLDCSESKIYKLEAGDVGVNRGDLLVMLDRYKVPEDDPRREAALDLQKQGRQRGWWSTYGTIPTNYSLSQNYPNPFNAQTSISFALPHAGHVNISIYDILGRLISTPVNEFYDAGDHNINLDMTDIPSGLYFYVLKTDDTEIKRKMLLLK